MREHLFLRKKMPWHWSGIVVFTLVAFLFFALPSHSMAADSSDHQQCTKDLTTPSSKPGQDIINAVFNSVQAVLKSVAYTMYNGVLGSKTYSNTVAAVMGIYVLLYGFMVMFNMTSLRLGEISMRLARMALIFTFISPAANSAGIPLGWFWFDQIIGQFFIGGMNELILDFATSAGASLPSFLANTSTATYTMQSAVLDTLYVPMNTIIHPKPLISILGLATLGPVGIMMAFALVFAIYEFMTMVIGAVVTYIRAMVGLSFLFGVAPIFFIFLLFQQTRNIFFGWLNVVISFALSPVMLFAFLAFYGLLMTVVVSSLFDKVDFCWTRWFSLAGSPADVSWWRPSLFDSGTNTWNTISGDWKDPATGNPREMPINIVNVLFFVIISYLGKNFCNNIDVLTQNLTGGIGAGAVSGEDVNTFFRNNLMGGRGITERAASGFGGLFRSGGGSNPTVIGKRSSPT